MAEQPGKPNRKYHIKRSKNRLTNEFIQECTALQERILERHGGEPLPSSVDIIRAHRDGMCVECGRDIVDVAEQTETKEREANQMAESKSSRKVRVSRPRRIPAKSWIEEARQVRKLILDARGGVPVPSSADVIREIREGDRE